MRVFQLAIAASAAVALLCCGGTTPSPSAPSPTTPPVTSVVSGVTTVVAKVTVAGIFPRVGTSSQFSAVALLADGSHQTITSQASWSTSDPVVATVSSTGMVTGVGVGSVWITATYGGVSGFLAFTVGSAPPDVVGCPAITFDNAGSNNAPFTTYTACGFTMTATAANWTVWTNYGNPAPAIVFTSAAGTATTGEITVTAGTKFKFQSVDIYSSTTPIPYLITGIAGSAIVFTIQNTQPNTFGNFARVTNPNAGAAIDTLMIRLSNTAAPCCSNPMGLDNIVVSY